MNSPGACRFKQLLIQVTRQPCWCDPCRGWRWGLGSRDRRGNREKVQHYCISDPNWAEQRLFVDYWALWYLTKKFHIRPVDSCYNLRTDCSTPQRGWFYKLICFCFLPVQSCSPISFRTPLLHLLAFWPPLTAHTVDATRPCNLLRLQPLRWLLEGELHRFALLQAAEAFHVQLAL